MLASAAPAGNSSHADVHHASSVFKLLDCPIYGHDVTFHFLANDIIMIFHFGLAMKEVTEAMLPGGSLNPPRKALNPIICTIGGVIGPVVVYFALLQIFIECGFFDMTVYNYEMLSKGWGIVTATDIPLAWLVSLIVFGHGHPAIDFLLLLAVADDALGMLIIAIFYPDPDNPTEWKWLGLVALAMFLSWCLRKWHFRKRRATHQSFWPYIFVAILSWLGLLWAHMHPALALVPIVPFMPGPSAADLENFEEGIENAMEDLALGVKHEQKPKKKTTTIGKITQALASPFSKSPSLRSTPSAASAADPEPAMSPEDHTREEILDEGHDIQRRKSGDVSAKALALVHQHDTARGRGTDFSLSILVQSSDLFGFLVSLVCCFTRRDDPSRPDGWSCRTPRRGVPVRDGVRRRWQRAAQCFDTR
jgi:hypothetical protein